MLLFGTFEERGYRFESYIPSLDTEPVAFELRIIVGEVTKYSLLVPMLYVPTFGVDAGDIQSLEATLDRILPLLPEIRDFGPNVILALSKLEEDVGGNRGIATDGSC